MLPTLDASGPGSKSLVSLFTGWMLAFAVLIAKTYIILMVFLNKIGFFPIYNYSLITGPPLNNVKNDVVRFKSSANFSYF